MSYARYLDILLSIPTRILIRLKIRLDVLSRAKLVAR